MPSLTHSAKPKKKSYVKFVLFFVGLYALVLAVIFYPEYKNYQLRQSGIEAFGKILRVKDTGNRHNQMAQLEFIIEVTPNQGKKFEGKAKMLVSPTNLPHAQTGKKVKVKYDPKDKTSLVIVSFFANF